MTPISRAAPQPWQYHSGQSESAASGHHLPVPWCCSSERSRPQSGQCRMMSVIGTSLPFGSLTMLSRHWPQASDLRRRVLALLQSDRQRGGGRTTGSPAGPERRPLRRDAGPADRASASAGVRTGCPVAGAAQSACCEAVRVVASGVKHAPAGPAARAGAAGGSHQPAPGRMREAVSRRSPSGEGGERVPVEILVNPGDAAVADGHHQAGGDVQAGSVGR
jgi:hypothetical protein